MLVRRVQRFVVRHDCACAGLWSASVQARDQRQSILMLSVGHRREQPGHVCGTEPRNGCPIEAGDRRGHCKMPLQNGLRGWVGAPVEQEAKLL